MSFSEVMAAEEARQGLPKVTHALHDYMVKTHALHGYMVKTLAQHDYTVKTPAADVHQCRCSSQTRRKWNP
jgi:hypothetical protein